MTRSAKCLWCGEPYETDLMEGSDGICKACYESEMVKHGIVTMEKITESGLVVRVEREAEQCEYTGK